MSKFSIRELSEKVIPGGIGRQASLVVIGDAINFGTAFVSTMILARIIPVDDMGTFRQVNYLGAMVVLVVELGISSSIYRFWNLLGEDKRGVYLRMLVICTGAAGLLGTLFLVIFARSVSLWYNNPALVRALLITASFPLATIPPMILRPILISQGYALRATLLETLFSLISIFTLIIPVLLGANLFVALAFWSGGNFCRLLFIPVIFNHHLFSPSQVWDQQIFRDVWQFIWPIQLSRLPSYLIAYTDKIVSAVTLSTRDFAIYSMGAREIPFVGTICYSVAGVLLPHLVDDVQQGRMDQLTRRWRVACERTALVTYPVGAFCVWFALPVVQFLFSAQYSESKLPFQVFAALTFIRVIEYASLAKALGRTDKILISALVGAGTVLLTILPLAHFLQGFGMALAFLLSTLTSAIYLLIFYQKVLKQPIHVFYPWPRLLAIVTLSFLSVMASDLLIAPAIDLTASTRMFDLGWKLSLLFTFSIILYGSIVMLIAKTGSRLWLHLPGFIKS